MIASKKFSCKAVIFDMDGTLIESTNADFLAWQKVFLDYGKNLTFNDYSPLLGKRSVAVVKDLLKITSEEERANALSNKSKYFFEVIEQQGLKTVPFGIMCFDWKPTPSSSMVESWIGNESLPGLSFSGTSVLGDLLSLIPSVSR